MFKRQNLLKFIHKRLIILYFDTSMVMSLNFRFDLISFSNDNMQKTLEFSWSNLTLHRSG